MNETVPSGRGRSELGTSEKDPSAGRRRGEDRLGGASGGDPAALDPLPVRIGVSSCLLGREVRFDGGHKKDGFLVHDFGLHVEWVPVCPEVEAGMGIPREAVRLVRREGEPDGALPRMVGGRSGEDWTDRMVRLSEARVKALEDLDLSGYVLKSKSPSCGMERVKVYGPKGMAEKNGRGLFAVVLLERMPWLPVEEEGRLCDPVIRENFIERVFAYHRWLLFGRERYSTGRLVEFHRRHKFLLMAHSEKHMRELGRIVAAAKGKPKAEVLRAYGEAFFAGLGTKTTVRRHVNVLQHIAGFLKEKIDAGDRKELAETIENYRQGLVPRIVPQTLILHHLRRAEVPYMADQYYLSPGPRELALKYHL
jgi:uncharacterized protein YbgA (DUF1722 family)/uncharacterized protein YbbK (DUF523 family)